MKVKIIEYDNEVEIEVKKDQIFTHINGDLEMEDIEGLPYYWIEWDEILATLFDPNQNNMINLLLNSSNLITGAKKKNKGEYTDWKALWKEYVSNFNQLNQITSVHNNLKKIRSILDEKVSISKKIKELDRYESRFNSIKQDNTRNAQLEQLNKLKTELDRLQGEYEIKKDEFLLQENRKSQVNTDIKEQKNSILLLKTQQNDYFNKINDITKLVDEDNDLLHIYEEKLSDLELKREKSTDNLKIEEDYSRIKEKRDIIIEKQNPLKLEKKNLIDYSKKIKKSLSDLNQSLRGRKKSVNEITRKFNEAQSKFKEIENRYKSLQIQIERIETKINSFIQEKGEDSKQINEDSKQINEDSHSDSGSSQVSNDPIPYTSLYIIKEKLSQNSEKLIKINENLQKLFETSEIDQILSIIDEKQNVVFQKNNTVRTFIGKYQKLVKEDNLFKQLLSILSSLEHLLNLFLSRKNIEGLFKFYFNEDNIDDPSIEFELKDTETDKIIDIQTDLKRKNRAYLYYCFISCFYLINGSKFIPFNGKYLPRFMTTEKTFISVLEDIESIIKNELPSEISEIPQYFFILPEKYNGIDQIEIK